jgi:hypothetical protein
MAFEETSLGRSQQGLKTRYGYNDMSAKLTNPRWRGGEYEHSHSHVGAPSHENASVIWRANQSAGDCR